MRPLPHHAPTTPCLLGSLLLMAVSLSFFFVLGYPAGSRAVPAADGPTQLLPCSSGVNAGVLPRELAGGGDPLPSLVPLRNLPVFAVAFEVRHPCLPAAARSATDRRALIPLALRL